MIWSLTRATMSSTVDAAVGALGLGRAWVCANAVPASSTVPNTNAAEMRRSLQGHKVGIAHGGDNCRLMHRRHCKCLGSSSANWSPHPSDSPSSSIRRCPILSPHAGAPDPCTMGTGETISSPRKLPRSRGRGLRNRLHTALNRPPLLGDRPPASRQITGAIL